MKIYEFTYYDDNAYYKKQYFTIEALPKDSDIQKQKFLCKLAYLNVYSGVLISHYKGEFKVVRKIYGENPIVENMCDGLIKHLENYYFKHNSEFFTNLIKSESSIIKFNL